MDDYAYVEIYVQTIIISNKHVIYIVFLMSVQFFRYHNQQFISVTKNISSVCVLLRF